MTCEVKVIEDSTNPYNGQRLTTMQLRYWRAIHGEFMTHRTFCLAGDARLDFDMSSKSSNGSRRVHSMSIKEFVEKWLDGAQEHKPSRHNGRFLSLPSRSSYTAKEIADALGFKNALNLNHACRSGKVVGARKEAGQWVADADAWEAYRNKTGVRRFSLRSRLAGMNIRQINERTGEIQTSKVVNVQRSGAKEVFEVRTLNYKVAASADHLVFTDRGWVRVADLVVGKDMLATYKYGTGAKDDPFKKIDGRWVSTWNNSVRDEVARRQGGKCVRTGEPLGSDFHIHHVVPRHQRPDLAFDIDNVVALTPDAHREIHGIQGWQDGVPLQSGFEVVMSVELRGVEETFDLEIAGEFPNFFANGVVVHNSRNASSSRAIPINTVLKQVWNEPAGPVHWGSNNPGMQSKQELTGFKRWFAQKTWNLTGKVVCSFVWLANKVSNPHKQIFNRLLEPWQYISVIVTATEWDNFFELRNHPDAQPEIQELAKAMREAIIRSIPTERQYHLPYVTNEERKTFTPEECMMFSTARCARVSYLTHDGKKPSIEKDIELYRRLVGSIPIHASPTEHPATAVGTGGRLDVFVKNFRGGWVQHRVDVEDSIIK